MKKLLLIFLLGLLHTAVKAQVTTLKTINSSACNVSYIIYASDPGTCNNAYQSIGYTISPSTTPTFQYINTITWSGLIAPLGSSITAAMVIDCSGLGYMVGDPCTGAPPSLPPTTLCSCLYSNIQWVLGSGPNQTDFFLW